MQWRILISPAKKMRDHSDFPAPCSQPVLLHKTETLLQRLRTFSPQHLQQLLGCNADIAALNYDRFQKMQLDRQLSSAILAYDGIQYQYMAPQVFEDRHFIYIQKYLRILSGFYGILRPLDGICSYRLEMQAPLVVENHPNLYSFWGNALWQQLQAEQCEALLDLSSAEYSKAVRPYLPSGFPRYTCIFGQQLGQKIIEKGVYVKMARGEMVRWLAEQNCTDPLQLKNFNRLGYCYSARHSTSDTFVFIKP